MPIRGLRILCECEQGIPKWLSGGGDGLARDVLSHRCDAGFATALLRINGWLAFLAIEARLCRGGRAIRREQGGQYGIVLDWGTTYELPISATGTSLDMLAVGMLGSTRVEIL